MSPSERGQIIVEYVLLLVIAVGAATLIVSQLVSRDPDEPGIIIGKWQQILTVIGQDLPDDVTPEQP